MLPLTLACSMCGEMLFAAQYWWARAYVAPLLALLLDAVLLGILSRLREQPVRASRASVVLPALGLPVVGTLVGFGSSQAMWALVAVALAATARSIAANRALGSHAALVRAALVLGGLALGLVLRAPSRHPTEELARTAAYVTKLHRDEGWVFEELQRRPDAPAALAALFKDPGRLNAPQALVLHARFGFPAAAREEACARVDREKEEAVREACGPPPRAVPEGGPAGAVTRQRRGASSETSAAP